MVRIPCNKLDLSSQLKMIRTHIIILSMNHETDQPSRLYSFGEVIVTKCCGCFNVKFGHDMYNIIHSPDLDLDPLHKRLFVTRYLKTTQRTEIKARMVSALYFVLLTTTIIIGVSVPAIMSLSANSSDKTLFWVTWSFSLGLAIINGLVGTFKIQREYIVLNSMLVRLKGEGWAFLELCGQYSQPTTIDGLSAPACHRNKIQHFFNRIEYLKQKQFIAEFSSKEHNEHETKSIRRGTKTSIGTHTVEPQLIDNEDSLNRLMSTCRMVDPQYKRDEISPPIPLPLPLEIKGNPPRRSSTIDSEVV